MLEIQIQERTQLKRKAKQVLEQGYIPAVLYGPKLSSKPVSVNRIDFEKVYKQAGETALISLLLEDTKEIALIKSPQYDVVSGQVVHIDFYQPPLDKKVEVTIPLVFEGESDAVNDLGGVLMRNLHEISISALPQDLINEIIVDIGGLKELDDVITVENILSPNNIDITNDPSTVVAFIKSPLQQQKEQEQEEQAEQQEQEQEQTEGETIADIKTEGEEKREKQESEETTQQSEPTQEPT